MSSGHNTIFLRLDGPLQSWGDTSKFVIRRSMDAPTKSGVLGLICCAMGWSRRKVVEDPIPDEHLRELAQRLVQRREDDKCDSRRSLLDLLNTLVMAVRVDRPGTRWWDYHTVGAGVGMTTAAGGVKHGAAGTLITRREYLADAGFLVALQGKAALIQAIADALASPKWPLYLGRKSCPPCTPILVMRKCDDGSLEPLVEAHPDVESSLSSPSLPHRPRHEADLRDDKRVLRCGRSRDDWKIKLNVIREWRRTDQEPTAPPEAEVWYDAPFSFDPSVHHPRLVIRDSVTVQVGDAIQHCTPAPPRPRADYRNSEYQKRRAARLEADHGLCVFCKNTATTVQHITYRRAGGGEEPDDLRSLCRLCHDAVTMVEYGAGMGLDRINPEEERWREDILRTRAEILQFRSEEGRRRALRDAPERVRREQLEQEE